MRKNIPATTLITCDLCKSEVTKYQGVKEARLIIHRNAVDWQGYAVAKGDLEMDLCDMCEARVSDLIEGLKQ